MLHYELKRSILVSVKQVDHVTVDRRSPGGPKGQLRYRRSGGNRDLFYFMSSRTTTRTRHDVTREVGSTVLLLTFISDGE